MQERKKKDLRFRYQYFLYDAMVESQKGKGSPDFHEVVLARFLEEEKKNQLDKQILTVLLVDLKRSFTGSSEAQLLRLADALHLPEYAYQKLKSRHWSTQAQGIREISNIKVLNDSFLSEITDLSTSPTPAISQEAQIALVKLSNPPDLSFLNDLSTSLSHWQQIHLFHHLRTVDKECLPIFSQWLTSDNESVVIFSLRMIAEFEQRSNTELILQQLNHPSQNIILETIRTITQLKLIQALDALIKLLQHGDHKIQISCIQAIGYLGKNQHLPYLNAVMAHDDYWIRRMASTAVKQLEQSDETSTTSSKPSLQPLD
uniref:HEAT repeat domain-containing protein n=1 Tax=Roseihalotalea indica TaxID=2867963 RepID=A0AA49GQZ1_9BACT|nr:HEAT repeat domain-containing protein [Tunicatimonas sp. TK19036]